MLTKIHNLLISPGGTAKIYCKDGLSSATLFQIDHLFNFGGNLKFVNCGAENIYAGIKVALDSMGEEVNKFNEDTYGMGMIGPSEIDLDTCIDFLDDPDYVDIIGPEYKAIFDICRAWRENENNIRKF